MSACRTVPKSDARVPAPGWAGMVSAALSAPELPPAERGSGSCRGGPEDSGAFVSPAWGLAFPVSDAVRHRRCQRSEV